jgi:hypothetical protein
VLIETAEFSKALKMLNVEAGEHLRRVPTARSVTNAPGCGSRTPPRMIAGNFEGVHSHPNDDASANRWVVGVTASLPLSITA